MTVSTTTTRTSYSGNGVTTVFSFPYKFLADGDLVVLLVDQNDNYTVQTIATHYTVSGAGADAGGTVTMTSPPSSTESLVIYRDTEITQEVDYITGDAFPAETHETALDKLTLVTQEIRSSVDRSLQASFTDTTVSMELPAASVRADKLLQFDTNGSPSVVSSEDFVAGLGNAIISVNYVTNNATGDGSTTAYALSTAPGSKTNVQVYIDGVYQNKASFSLAGTTLTFTEAPPLNASVEFMIGYALSTVGDDAGSITYTQGGTGAQTRTIESRLQDVVSVKDFGAVGDGVTDDTAAIQAALDAANGKPVHFIGSDTYKFTSQLSIPANSVIKTNQCTFNLTTSIAGNTPAILINAGSIADCIKVSIATSVTVDRVVNIADNCNIDRVEITSVDQINNRTDTLDGAVCISGDNVRVGAIKTTNYDNGAVVYQSDNFYCDSMLFTSFVRGVLFREVDSSYAGSIKTTTASPNAGPNPGNNGVLLEQVTNSEFPTIGIQNSGEHAVRIGSGVTAPSKNLTFGTISAWKPGQCGFKINDGTYTTQYISVGQILVTDCATGSATGSNEDPVRLEKAKDITIGVISGNTQDKANCGNDGVYINKCERVKIGVVELENPLNTGIKMIDADGQFRDIEIDNVKINGCAGNGIEITSNTSDLEHIVIHDGYIRDINGAAGCLITTNDPTGSTGVTNPVIVRFKFHSGTGTAYSTTSSAGRLYDRTETFS